MIVWLRYLAYGSNLLPARLLERVPSARVIGPVRLPGRELRFHKRGMDGSAKCDLVASRRRAVAYGVVYELLACERGRLDRAEGLGMGYRLAAASLQGIGPVFYYRADPRHVDQELLPFDWYRDLVVAGAARHGFPAAYLARLSRVSTTPDADRGRAVRARRLLTRVQGLVQSAAPDVAIQRSRARLRKIRT